MSSHNMRERDVSMWFEPQRFEMRCMDCDAKFGSEKASKPCQCAWVKCLGHGMEDWEFSYAPENTEGFFPTQSEAMTAWRKGPGKILNDQLCFKLRCQQLGHSI